MKVPIFVYGGDLSIKLIQDLFLSFAIYQVNQLTLYQVMMYRLFYCYIFVVQYYQNHLELSVSYYITLDGSKLYFSTNTFFHSDTYYLSNCRDLDNLILHLVILTIVPSIKFFIMNPKIRFFIFIPKSSTFDIVYIICRYYNIKIVFTTIIKLSTYLTPSTLGR